MKRKGVGLRVWGSGFSRASGSLAFGFRAVGFGDFCSSRCFSVGCLTPTPLKASLHRPRSTPKPYKITAPKPCAQTKRMKSAPSFTPPNPDVCLSKELATSLLPCILPQSLYDAGHRELRVLVGYSFYIFAKIKPNRD